MLIMEIKTFKGSFYETGRQQGEIYKKNGADFKDVTIDPTVYKKQLDVYKKYYPEFLEKLKGIADAGGFDRDKLNYAFISGGLLAYINNFDLNKACTIFGIKNENGIFVGRNYDWIPEIEKIFQVYRVVNPKRNAFIAISDMDVNYPKHKSPKYQMYDPDDAINDKGLFIGLTFAYADSYSYGITCTHMIELIAETCATVEDAINVFKKVPLCYPKNFFIADKNGDMAVVEHTSKRFRVVRPKNDILVKTNNYVDPELAKEDTTLIHLPQHNTFLRYDEVLQKLSATKEKFSFSDIIGVLGKKGSYVCQNHPGVRTIWSLGLDMKRQKYKIYWDLFKKRKEMELKV